MQRSFYSKITPIRHGIRRLNAADAVKGDTAWLINGKSLRLSRADYRADLIWTMKEQHLILEKPEILNECRVYAVAAKRSGFYFKRKPIWDESTQFVKMI